MCSSDLYYDNRIMVGGTMKSDKITVEFSRKELKENCKINCPVYRNCDRTDKDLIKCLLVVSVDYKIKEQKNDNRKN